MNTIEKKIKDQNQKIKGQQEKFEKLVNICRIIIYLIMSRKGGSNSQAKEESSLDDSSIKGSMTTSLLDDMRKQPKYISQQEFLRRKFKNEDEKKQKIIESIKG